MKRRGELVRPFIQITLCDRDGQPAASERALLDTGASWSLIPEKLVEPLGWTREELREEEFGSAGGVTTAWVAPEGTGMVDVELEGGVRVPVIPAFSPHVDWPVLGCSDFLARFMITYDATTNEIFLTPRPGVPQPNGLDIENRLQANLDALVS